MLSIIHEQIYPDTAVPESSEGEERYHHHCLNHNLAEIMFRERHEGHMLADLFSILAGAHPSIDY